ncbi:GTP cyclohydrolase [Candidatus Riesia sp. GBBU]|nr:GTP cyclohydrolase [Candidatus Riesia sp. GBBU]ARC55053.1 GTP cyclohydrolase [Candidatus Riesia sp. GBBU]
MSSINQESVLVHKALKIHGLENSFYSNKALTEDTEKKIAVNISNIMNLLKFDVSNCTLSETPKRVAKMYVEEIFSGLNYRNFPRISFIKNKMKVDEIISVKNISLITTCEHHLTVIDGNASIKYLPNDRIIGFSKIIEIVYFFSKRPQIQERLTKQILIALQTLLRTKDISVSISAIHYCTKLVGSKDITNNIVTNSYGGIFKRRQKS